MSRLPKWRDFREKLSSATRFLASSPAFFPPSFRRRRATEWFTATTDRVGKFVTAADAFVLADGFSSPVPVASRDSCQGYHPRPDRCDNPPWLMLVKTSFMRALCANEHKGGSEGTETTKREKEREKDGNGRTILSEDLQGGNENSQGPHPNPRCNLPANLISRYACTNLQEFRTVLPLSRLFSVCPSCLLHFSPREQAYLPFCLALSTLSQRKWIYARNGFRGCMRNVGAPPVPSPREIPFVLQSPCFLPFCPPVPRGLSPVLSAATNSRLWKPTTNGFSCCRAVRSRP